jgi:transposase-like protein
MLLLASSVCGLFKWRQFEPEVILVAVGWYLRFSLSYRDVEELLAERGLHADHVTVWRWVQRYAPELQRCLRRHLKPTNDSWRMDETYVRVTINVSSISTDDRIDSSIRIEEPGGRLGT